MKKLWHFVDEDDEIMTLTDYGLCLEKITTGFGFQIILMEICWLKFQNYGQYL